MELQCYNCSGWYNENQIRLLPFEGSSRTCQHICHICQDVLTTCKECGISMRDNILTDASGQTWCRDCYTEHFKVCDFCGCEIANEWISHEVDYGKLACDSCYEELFFTCQDCGDTYLTDEVRYDPNGEPICRCCFEDGYGECSECGLIFNSDNLNSSGCDLYCSDCYQQDQWTHAGFFDENPTYNEVGSTRKYGIELETHSCPDHSDLHGETIFGCKPDGSVDGMEFISPVLNGDAGFDELDKLCQFSRRHGWEVNSSCGYHLHCDMTEENDENLFKIALAYHYTYSLWCRFVSNPRIRNYYCAHHEWDETDIVSDRDFSDFIYESGNEKYRWFNVAAYLDHRTFEIRIHGGTMNPTKIKNWAKAHLRFIDAVAKMTLEEITDAFAGVDVAKQFNIISQIWDDVKLTEFYTARAEHFNKSIRVESLVEAAT